MQFLFFDHPCEYDIVIVPGVHICLHNAKRRLFLLFQKNVEELLQRKGGGLSQDGSTVCVSVMLVCILLILLEWIL